MQSLIQAFNDIKSATNIAIFCHTTPDTDTLSSAVALKKLIKSNYETETSLKNIDIFVDSEEFGELNSAIIKGIDINKQNAEKYEVGISVDCASIERLGKYAELFNSCNKTINFDHHLTNPKFAQNNLVVMTSSTCEAIYLLAKSQKLIMSDDFCSLVYSGLITDTNNLTQGTISVHTHKVISEIIAQGINITALNDHFFKNNTKSKAFLLQKALSSLTFTCSDRIAFMKLTKQDLAENNATMEDTQGIVNHGINIKGVDIAILAIKQEDNSYYVSLRGKNNVNVAVIATQLGGGGHEQVAAFQYDGLLQDMKDELLKFCKEELTNHPIFEENLFDNDDNKPAQDTGHSI